MNKPPFYETVQRGTVDFPIGFYRVDKSHPCYQMRMQWHNDMEIERVIQGQLNVSVGGKIYEMRENQSLILPPGVIHAAEAKNCVYECIVFSPNILYSTKKIRTDIETKLLKPVLLDNDERVSILFESLRSPYPGYEIKVISDLYALTFTAINEQKNAIEGKAEYRTDRVKAAISYIEENYAKEITLDALSKICSMSPSYFCRFFKEATGQTPNQYINAYRIEQACEILFSGNNVTETAFACGFNDLSYFINVFKKRMGVSPKQYLKKI